MNTLDALFNWFLAATVRGSLLAIAILILQAAFGKWLPARWRFAMWLPVVLVLLSPVLPQSRWSLENLRRAPAVETGSRTNHSPLELIAAQPELPPMPGESLVEPNHGWRGMLAMVWLGGLSLASLSAFAAYARTLRKMREDAVAPTAMLNDLLDQAVASSGLRAPPRLLVSTAVKSPAVTGFLRPLLLIPADFDETFGHEEARLVLLHELTHIRRWDLPLNWLLCLAQALHWCNPLVWLAVARMRTDRETACDARVLAIAGGDCREDYGNALLTLEGALSPVPSMLGFVGIFERAAGLKTRIRAIATHRRTHPAWGMFAAALIFGLCLVGATRAKETLPPATQGTDAGGKNVSTEVGNPTQEALDAIIIPKLEFRGVTLAKALDFFSQKSLELDPKKRGVKFVLKNSVGEAKTTPLTIALSDVPIIEALKYVTTLSGCVFTVTEDGVAVFAVNKALNLQIPNLELRNVTAADAVQALQSKALSVDPDYKPTTLVIAPDALAAARKTAITLSFTNQSLWQAAATIAELADLETALDENGLTLRHPALHLVQTKIGYPTVAALVRNDARKYAEAHGVTFPPGSSISWNPSSGFLVMKNYRKNNDRLSDAIGAAIQEASRQAAISAAKGILIPRVDFTQTTLREVINSLRKESIARDPAHRGINIALALGPNGLPKGVEPFDLHLKDTTLWDALQSVADAAGLDLQPEDRSVFIVSKAPAAN